MNPIDLAVTLGRKCGNDEIAVFGKQPVAVCRTNNEGGARTLRPRGQWPRAFPNDFTAGNGHRPQIALFMKTVDVIVGDKWLHIHSRETMLGLVAPHNLDAGLVAQEL